MSFILTFVLFHIMYCPHSLLFCSLILSHSTPDRLPFLVTVLLLGCLSYCARIVKEALSKHDQLVPRIEKYSVNMVHDST